MSGKGHKTVASCSRCGTKHPRPVGTRCKRTLNVSAPNIREHQSSDEDSSDSVIRTQDIVHGHSGATAAQEGGAHISQVESKLDMILQKMQKLENKNQALEEQFAASQGGAALAKLSHSSPKRSHKCSSEDSGEEDVSISTHSSAQASRISHCDSMGSHPSVELLKQDHHTQRQVQKQLQRLQGLPRASSSRPGKAF